jgi:serine/threonine protein kinase
MSFTADPSDTREQLLDEVLADYMKAAQEGRAPSRRTLLERHPDLADELASFFADQDHVDQLAAPLRALAPAEPLPGAGAILGDYELLEEIAQGGMGVVYRARQQSLQRIVAVKVLQAGPLASPQQWQRFQAEAEAIASLDHPNIVPVYEVGVHDGRPFFSMKLLDGGSLAQQLKDGYRPSPREAAQLLATIADAVHYAHERGILHRDLKPANILLDARGQPHVSDFGLAKRALPCGEAGAAPAAVELTVSGAIVGTPSYMAPEQAAGSRVLTTAADVYGLGAILYELLTGRPPFRGVDLFDTLRRLQDEEPRPPRALNPRLDRDLETICLYCLCKEPGQRYAGAAELARDLRRYLAGEPIGARPVGPLQRGWRWCRRRPFAAAAAAAFVLVIVTAVALIDWQRRRAETSNQAKEALNESLQDSNLHLETTNVHLSASREKGRRMIDELCRQLSTDGWGEDPVIQAKRKELLEQGLRYYRDFLDDPNAEAPAREELIRAYFRIGDISSALGSSEQSAEAFGHARTAAEALLQRKPEDAGARLWLARIDNRLGTLHKNARRTTDAQKAYRAAHDLLADLHRAAPDDLDVEAELAVSCNNLGNLYHGMSRLEDARTSYRECVDLNRDLCRRSTDAQFPYALAVALGNLAVLSSDLRHRDEAWRYSDEANRLLRGLDLTVPRYRQELGHNLFNRGALLGDEKRYAEAVQALKEGREVLTRLVEMQPRITAYQNDLARLLRQLGHTYRALGDKDKTQFAPALEAYQAAHKIYQELAVREPRSSDWRYAAAGCFFDAGIIHGTLERRKEAIQAYQTARDELRRLVQAEPDKLDYLRLLGLTLNNLGRQQWLSQRPDEALASLREGLKHNRLSLQRTPENLHSRRVFYTSYVFLTDVYRGTSRRDELIAVLRERRAVWPDSPADLFATACELAQVRDDDEAMRTLEWAIRKGFKDRRRLESEPALIPLRQRGDFSKLMPERKAPP